MTAWRWFRRQPWLYYWSPLVIWMGLIFFLSAQPDLPHPDTGWVSFLVSSGAHAFVYGVLIILWLRILQDRPRAAAVALSLTLLYALSDEFHQAFVPGRHPDLWDLWCDGLGAVAGLLLWKGWQRRLRAGA